MSDGSTGQFFTLVCCTSWRGQRSDRGGSRRAHCKDRWKETVGFNSLRTFVNPQTCFRSVGIGSDFDGIGSTPEGLEDVSKYPALVSASFVHSSNYLNPFVRSLNFIVGAGTSTS